MTIIDPPSGWRYGFPKPIPEDRKKDTTVWLVEQGYPQKLIDEYGDFFMCRYWEEPDQDSVVHDKAQTAVDCYYQQTAVDWIVDQMLSEGHKEMWKDMIQQAKQMEKEQIVDSHIEGQRVFDKHPHTQWTNDQAEQYYNKTYGKENNN